MPYESGLSGPNIVSYTLASEAYAYMMRIIALGFIEGDIGNQKVAEDMRKVLDAMHQVLAGGEVKTDVVHRGNPDIVTELHQRLDNSQKEANEINKHAGYYFTTL